MVLLRESLAGLIHLFYPKLCEGCGKPLVASEEVVCLSCALELPETNFSDIENNETALRFAGRIPFIYATTYAYFTEDGLLQHLLHGLKYKNKQEIGFFLGKQLGLAILKSLAQKTGKAHPAIDLIVPVPLHAAKQAKRGYNQSLLIAEGISHILKIPVCHDAVLRVKDTDSQTKKTRSERIDNMSDAFKINSKYSFEDKHILLCDDVLTTGATLEACAQALLAQKSIKISFATIGIAIS